MEANEWDHKVDPRNSAGVRGRAAAGDGDGNEPTAVAVEGPHGPVHFLRGERHDLFSGSLKPPRKVVPSACSGGALNRRGRCWRAGGQRSSHAVPASPSRGIARAARSTRRDPDLGRLINSGP